MRMEPWQATSLSMYIWLIWLFSSGPLAAPPQIDIWGPKGTSEVPLGSRFTPYCLAKGNPAPRLEWLRHGQLVDLSRFTIEDSGVRLELATVQQEDAGMYECRAISEYGEVVRKFELKVNFPPRLNSDAQRHYTLERMIDSSVLLECDVTGSPEPEIEWFKDGALLDLPKRMRQVSKDASLPSAIGSIKDDPIASSRIEVMETCWADLHLEIAHMLPN
ncbi:unnamed protein product [Protopolystoma xenopodis]|uniref:Ig-like domain-containing protein n=1 Tax=Protopolystoma xenopodis TaxID=117903 RepID=A0A3S5AE70_9PLAT|nr:unnamed protein product [Protopolystoma xenopodis]